MPGQEQADVFLPFTDLKERVIAEALTSFALNDFPAPDDDSTFHGPGGPRMRVAAALAVLRLAASHGGVHGAAIRAAAADVLSRAADQAAQPIPVPWRPTLVFPVALTDAARLAAHVLQDWDGDPYTHPGSHPVPPDWDGDPVSLVLILKLSDLLEPDEARAKMISAVTDGLRDFSNRVAERVTG